MINLELDHFGVIVKSIDKEISFYKKLGFEVDSKIFQDNNQQMRGVFLKPASEGKYRLELIQDLSNSNSLSNILNTRCGKIYHMAFRVNNLEKEINNILEELSARILSPIKDGEYYNKVCFIFLPNTQIIELVEYR